MDVNAVAEKLREYADEWNESCLNNLADQLDEVHQTIKEAFWILQGPKGYQDRCIDASEKLRPLVGLQDGDLERKTDPPRL